MGCPAVCFCVLVHGVPRIPFGSLVHGVPSAPFGGLFLGVPLLHFHGVALCSGSWGSLLLCFLTPWFDGVPCCVLLCPGWGASLLLLVT